MKMARQVEAYGVTQQLSVEARPASRSFTLGGVAEDARVFNHGLTDGAARMLWFHLTRHLYPEQAKLVTALVATAALSPIDQPGITTHVSADRCSNGLLCVLGEGETCIWSMSLNDGEAQRLWAQLDVALHPVGWKGRQSRGQ